MSLHITQVGVPGQALLDNLEGYTVQELIRVQIEAVAEAKPEVEVEALKNDQADVQQEVRA